LSLQDWVATALVAGGLFFFLVGGVGIVRFPDFYARMHPAGKGDTLGATLLVLGLAVHQGFDLLSLKLLLVEAFVLLANPAATHAVGRAAWRAGLQPWVHPDEAPPAGETPAEDAP
jgi:multicomponent Na+:H+ antiporter subunit G